MNALALLHHEKVGPSSFAAVIEARGHRLDVWSFSKGELPGPPKSYSALLVCGGPMRADDDVRYPWLAAERAFLERTLQQNMPVLGICLGAQLVAKAAGASVSA